MRPVAINLSLAELAVVHRAAELLGTTKSSLLLQCALTAADEYISSREGGAPGNPGHVFWSVVTPQTVTGTVHVAPSTSQLQRIERAAARVKMLRGSDVLDVSTAAFVIGATLRVLSRRRQSEKALGELRLPFEMRAVQRMPYR